MASPFESVPPDEGFYRCCRPCGYWFRSVAGVHCCWHLWCWRPLFLASSVLFASTVADIFGVAGVRCCWHLWCCWRPFCYWYPLSLMLLASQLLLEFLLFLESQVLLKFICCWRSCYCWRSLLFANDQKLVVNKLYTGIILKEENIFWPILNKIYSKFEKIWGTRYRSTIPEGFLHLLFRRLPLLSTVSRVQIFSCFVGLCLYNTVCFFPNIALAQFYKVFSNI